MTQDGNTLHLDILHMQAFNQTPDDSQRRAIKLMLFLNSSIMCW